MKDRFLNYGHQQIEEDDLKAVLDVLRGDFLTQGPAVDIFEQGLCDYTGAKYAVAVSSGTAALHVACLAAEIKKGMLGLTSTLTFVASANAYLYCGGQVKALDINPYNLGLSTKQLRSAIATTDTVKAITPVHFGGLACDTKEIREIAGSRVIIEDASHSLGGTYENGLSVGGGADADMTVFSFHPVKPITTGEGGAITTNDPDLHRRLKMFSNHGIERDAERFVNSKGKSEDAQSNPWYYEQQELGYNYRMSDVHAALGYAQLKKLDRFITRRRKIATMYDEAFTGHPAIALPQSNASDRQRSAHHLYLVEIDFSGLNLSRNTFVEKMRYQGIGGQIHYIPIHRQPFQQSVSNYDKADFKAAEFYYSRCLTLPIYPALTDYEVERVIAAVWNIVENRTPV